MEMRWLQRIQTPGGLVEDFPGAQVFHLHVLWTRGETIDAMLQSLSVHSMATHISGFSNTNVLQDPHEIPVETTHKAEPLRVWHTYDGCRVSSADKWTGSFTVICSNLLLAS